MDWTTAPVTIEDNERELERETDGNLPTGICMYKALSRSDVYGRIWK
ncbi:hypothetical protein MK805_00785 [Shimazuella sp. AN120528]|nr:hypothetical protein [Shimazuella soli]MCH5583506.1 hypothetical protein [Shimazuella soli]